MISPMTAATVLIKKGLVENIKSEALEIASLYQTDIKIEININKEQEMVKVNVIEYNL